jgi:S1-C subfamily serine protease
VTYAAAAVAAVSVSALIWQRVSQNARFETDRQTFLARADSLMEEMGSLTINMETLRGRFDSVQAEAARLRDSVSQPDQDPENVMLLRRRLKGALALQRQLTLAAALDLEAIAEANQAAVGIVLATFAGGTRVTGTGFGIRSDRFEGLVLTTKHVVLGIDDLPADALDIVFEGSTRALHLEVVSVHPDVDIALLRTRARGAVPAVASLQWREPPVAVGDAVATVGYPLGFELPMGGDWEQVGISATASPGSVTRVLPTLIQFDGFGVEGSSGSPVFDRDGSVVGLVYGSQAGGRGRILYSVPIVYALELLDGMP